MKVTKRDIELLTWINRYGFVTINHICKFLNIEKPTAYGYIKRFIKNKYLIHERIFHEQPGVYRVSYSGAKLTQHNIPAPRKVNIINYYHNLKLVDLSFSLTNKNHHITTEREIRHLHLINHKNKPDYTPDGIINNNIALELELTRKSKKRYDKIFKYYLENPQYKEVWYFSDNNEVINLLTKYSQEAKFIKIYNYND